MMRVRVRQSFSNMDRQILRRGRNRHKATYSSRDIEIFGREIDRATATGIQRYWGER